MEILSFGSLPRAQRDKALDFAEKQAQPELNEKLPYIAPEGKERVKKQIIDRYVNEMRHKLFVLRDGRLFLAEFTEML